jgi:hypothetical protein
MKTSRKAFTSFTLLIFCSLTACQSAGTRALTASTPTISISTATPRPVSTPTSTVFKIPTWLSDPKNKVLLVEDYDSGTSISTKHSVTFLDPNTGEKVTIQTKPFENAIWLDSDNIVFKRGNLCEYTQVAMVLTLSSGSYVRYNESQHQGTSNCISKEPKYWVYLARNASRDIVISKTSSDEPDRVISGSESQIYNWDAEISPDGSTIAAAQGHTADWSEASDQIAFYNTDSLELTRVYYDQHIESFHYSQDGKYLIYLKNKTPCKLSLESFSKDCGVEIPEYYQALYFGSTSQDGNRIVFISDLLDRASRVCFEDLQTGKSRCDYMNVQNSLCVYDIYTGEAKCPMYDIKDLFWSVGWVETTDMQDVFVQPTRNQHRVIRYLFSPDENFIVFTYGGGNPGGHFFYDTIKRGVTNVDGTIFYDLGESSTSLDASWRP